MGLGNRDESKCQQLLQILLSRAGFANSIRQPTVENFDTSDFVDLTRGAHQDFSGSTETSSTQSQSAPYRNILKRWFVPISS